MPPDTTQVCPRGGRPVTPPTPAPRGVARGGGGPGAPPRGGAAGGGGFAAPAGAFPLPFPPPRDPPPAGQSRHPGNPSPMHGPLPPPPIAGHLDRAVGPA